MTSLAGTVGRVGAPPPPPPLRYLGDFLEEHPNFTRKQTHLEQAFLFCCTWAMGGHLPRAGSDPDHAGGGGGGKPGSKVRRIEGHPLPRPARPHPPWAFVGHGKHAARSLAAALPTADKWRPPLVSLFLQTSSLKIIRGQGGGRGGGHDVHHPAFGANTGAAFSAWWRDEFKTARFPGSGSVFEYWLDPATASFSEWARCPLVLEPLNELKVLSRRIN